MTVIRQVLANLTSVAFSAAQQSERSPAIMAIGLLSSIITALASDYDSISPAAIKAIADLAQSLVDDPVLAKPKD